MKIEQIDNEIFVIDDFLTLKEEEHINLNLKGAVWRYNWPNYEELPFVRPCWHVFIAGKGRPDRLSCAQELENNEPWSFLTRFWERFSKLHNFDVTLLGVYANGQTFGQDTIIHRDNKTHPA